MKVGQTYFLSFLLRNSTDAYVKQMFSRLSSLEVTSAAKFICEHNAVATLADVFEAGVSPTAEQVRKYYGKEISGPLFSASIHNAYVFKRIDGKYFIIPELPQFMQFIYPGDGLPPVYAFQLTLSQPIPVGCLLSLDTGTPFFLNEHKMANSPDCPDGYVSHCSLDKRVFEITLIDPLPATTVYRVFGPELADWISRFQMLTDFRPRTNLTELLQSKVVGPYNYGWWESVYGW